MMNILIKVKDKIYISIAIAFILLLTLQSGEVSSGLSISMQKLAIKIAMTLGMSSEAITNAWWNDFSNFRKIGHAIEYFILGCTAMILMKNKHLGWLKATGCCAIVSLLDQTIKIFVPTRHFDWTDLPFDFLGYMAGIIVVILLSESIRKIKQTQ